MNWGIHHGGLESPPAPDEKEAGAVVIFVTADAAYLYAKVDRLGIEQDLVCSRDAVEEGGPLLEIGDWLTLQLRGLTIIMVRRRIEPGLESVVVDGELQVLARAILNRAEERVRSPQLGPLAFTDSQASLLQDGQPAGVWASPMTVRERLEYKELYGEEARWRIVQARGNRPESVNSFDDSWHTGVVVGVVVFKAYIWTPRAHPSFEGFLDMPRGERLEMGQWIRFKVSERDELLVFKEQRRGIRFCVKEFVRTSAVYPTRVLETGKTISLSLDDAVLTCENVENILGRVFIRHSVIGLIADRDGWLRPFLPIEHSLPVSLGIRRVRPHDFHGSAWNIVSINQRSNDSRS